MGEENPIITVKQLKSHCSIVKGLVHPEMKINYSPSQNFNPACCYFVPEENKLEFLMKALKKKKIYVVIM